MYRIHVDPAQSIIEVALGGLMTVDEVDAYIADLKQAFVTNQLRDYAMIIDVSACPIQSQEMIKRMGEHMATMPKSRALAVVTGSSLARMQIRRLFTQSYARIVTSASDGRAWVVSGTEPTS
ncbi:hypothetical protein [Sphingosinicella sp. BN140058]|uniref:hypothetical protein n=1 Tax=Sphingosinicella sp. BN140058 TaxID=1892855 RepID=UPI0010112F60|nr:hypothetical protein [Sphingosinicella sp. BN140058]QAY78132.1 hypothetical protein ETR14_17570 [Sphingosinicella sp. BN140058]